MRNGSYSFNCPGFSMIELMVALALFAIASGFALAVSLDSYRGANFRSQQDTVIRALQKARSQAMQNIGQTPHGVYFNATASSLTLFSGTDFAHRDAGFDQAFPLNAPVTLGGATSVVFSQLSATTSLAALTLDDHSHPIFTICLNGQGQINPAASCP